MANQTVSIQATSIRLVWLLLAQGLIWTSTAVVGYADLVTISTSQASGTNWVPGSNDFLGVLDSGSPATINGTQLNFNGPIPDGETFQAGAIVGRDVNEPGGAAIWSYDLVLPSDAAAGTGFQDIVFDAHAFERAVGNLDNGDGLSWAMYLNGNATAVGSGGIVDDFDTFDLTLLNAGGDSINQVSVLFSLNGYTDNNDWFSAQGLLSASYTTAIPEPVYGLLWIAVASSTWLTRRRRKS